MGDVRLRETLRILEHHPREVHRDVTDADDRRALVTRLHQSRRQRILVRHMVALCAELDARVVAEGIETQEELAAVIDCGVDYGQGYLFAQPSYPLPKAKWPGCPSVPPETAAKAVFGTSRTR